MVNPLTRFNQRASTVIAKTKQSRSTRIIVLACFGLTCAALGIFCLMLPLMTTPLIPQLALWHGLLKIGDHTRIEVYVGFWGVCTYHYKTSDPRKLIEIKSMCTPARPAYSFHMSDHVTEAKGDLNKTQTLFFFWYPVAAVLTCAAIVLSLSGNFRMWRYGSLVCLTAGILTFAAFAATLAIFSELTAELMNTQAASLVPVHGKILAETYLPFTGSIFLALASALLFARYLQGLRKYRNSGHNDLASGHNRSYWEQFRRYITRDPDENVIDLEGHEKHSNHKSHAELPPPPPLQDRPTREKEKTKEYIKKQPIS